jgi:predicted enzyme related to lactoylglutathione lyase
MWLSLHRRGGLDRLLHINAILQQEIIMTTNVKVNWFAIPTTDLDRAGKFCTTVFGAPLQAMESLGGQMLTFEKDGMLFGALTSAPGNQPGDHGSLAFLDTQGDIDAWLSAVESAGGKVALPKTGIGEHGAIAEFIDSEGNRIALHTL